MGLLQLRGGTQAREFKGELILGCVSALFSRLDANQAEIYHGCPCGMYEDIVSPRGRRRAVRRANIVEPLRNELE